MKESEKENLSDALKDVLQNSGSTTQERATRTILNQTSLMPLLANQNPELMARLIDFYSGNKRILFIIGESGMGKSLMGADLRKTHEDLQKVLPRNLKFPLNTLTWDRVHKNFFTAAETEANDTIKLPEGETDLEARIRISQVMSRAVLTVLDNFPHGRLVIEAPFFGNRGEVILPRLGEYHSQTQILAMHSPVSRDESLSGRIAEASGQPQAMLEMRAKLLELINVDVRGLSIEAQDELVKRWWINQISEYDGMVVEWDPNIDRGRYNWTIGQFKRENRRPDIIKPKDISWFVLNSYRDMFRAMKDSQSFLTRVTRSRRVL